MRAVDTALVFLSCGPCRSWTAPWSASTAACCSPSRVVCLHRSLCSGRRNCMWSLHVMTCLHHPSPWQCWGGNPLLYLSHWCSREEEDDEDSLKFATAPHTLQGGQQYYEFEEQEEADFSTHTNVGILKISEPQCLHCVKGKIGKSALYRAITFSRYTRTGKGALDFKIQFMCDSKDWIQVSGNVCGAKPHGELIVLILFLTCRA